MLVTLGMLDSVAVVNDLLYVRD